MQQRAATNRYKAAVIIDMFIVKYIAAHAICTFPHMT
jgi:hypothetical protein